jgi:hypothetical protein
MAKIKLQSMFEPNFMGDLKFSTSKTIMKAGAVFVLKQHAMQTWGEGVEVKLHAFLTSALDESE